MKVSLNDKQRLSVDSAYKISCGDVIYWDATCSSHLDYDPNILMHDSDGAEYSHQHLNVATGIVLEKAETPHSIHAKFTYVVYCEDGEIRRLPCHSVWLP